MQDIVLALILDETSLLVGKRPFPPYQSFIEVPGGKRAYKESLLQALARELAEEINLVQFHSRFFFQSKLSTSQQLYFFIVYPLGTYQNGIYPSLMKVPLDMIDALDWIPHNHTYVPYIKSLFNYNDAPSFYVYPSDDSDMVMNAIKALLESPDQIKKTPLITFKGCIHQYQTKHPDFFTLWSEYLVGS